MNHMLQRLPVGGIRLLLFSTVFAIGKTQAQQKEQDTAIRPMKSVNLVEVVAIGYGQQSRGTVTNSISKVKEAEFSHTPAANPLLQLQGKVAGLSLQVSDGQPGATPKVFLRGGTTASPEGDAPLYIIDGVIRTINEINPDDIESVQVLKDAASTAIYGARAANGIIIVTTKSGKSGKAVVNFKYTFGIEKQARRYDFTSARDYIYVSRKNTADFNKTNPDFFLTGGRYGMSTGNPRNSRNTLEFLDTYVQDYGQDYVNQLLHNEGWETMTDPVTGRELIFKETDYQDVTFQTAYKQEYDVNVSGGTDKATYYLGLGYLNQDGIVLGTFYKHYSGLFNGTYKVSDKLSFNTNLSYQVRRNSDAFNYQNVLSRSVSMPFTYRLNYEDGKPAPGEGITSFRNRNYEVYYKEKYNDVKMYRTTLRLGADWDLLPGLRFSPSFSWFTTEDIQNYFEASNETNTNRPASAIHNQDRHAQLDAILTYDKSLGLRHHIDAMLGTSYINDYVYTMSGSGRGAPTDNIPTLNASAPETQRISTYKSTDVVMSYFGRINYDYDQKYLFSASLRVDGSSRFSEQHKWGWFPGVSAGWNIDREDFWEPLSRPVSRMKLRASWGQAGNNLLSIFDSQGSYSTSYNYINDGTNNSVPVNYNGQAGILNAKLANNNLIWEVTTSFDVGLDIGLFDNRISLLVDYYNKLTSNRLFDKPLTASSGFDDIRSNFGSIRNSGFEVELSATPVRTANFSWDLGFTFAYNKGVVVELPENGEDKNRTGGNYVYDPAQKAYVKVGGLAEGERFGQRYAYNLVGVYATDEEAANAPADVESGRRQKIGGDAIWQDVDGNGEIDYRDMVFMGYIRPDKTGGMVNTLTYKGLTMRLVVDYAMGHVIDNAFRARSNASARNNNMTLSDVISDKIWKQQGDQASIPRYTVQSDVDYNWDNHLRPSNGIGASSGYSSNNSLYYKKGDYLAFRELSFSYRLKSPLLQKAYIQNLELFAGVYNIGYITGYDGLMPEVYAGNDPGLYPRPRAYNLGVKASF
ncbi:SusC/RagA family TonB-linked outer membrane protein [Chitinophaga japonensis]|nr:SusC/RagA family TonB-linked outer membrane protein [Chitinophaga japonensis]